MKKLFMTGQGFFFVLLALREKGEKREAGKVTTVVVAIMQVITGSRIYFLI